MSTKTILIFGASGTVGQGLIKAILERGYKAVGVFRSQESSEKTKERLGNPSQDNFIPVIGGTDTKENAAKLQRAVVDAAKEITDVVVSLGVWKKGGPLLQQSVDFLMECVGADKLVLHFLAAKYFLPLVQDKDGTSFTFINGAAAHKPIPNCGNITIAAASQLKLAAVLFSELAEKPVRINEVVIGAFVHPWDTYKPATNVVSNIEMGKALLGVIVNPAAKGQSMNVGAQMQDLKKLASEGKV